ncbi:DNA polymerase III subunit gamma/tau [bacterium]|nr:DNA polymerase III subunit gamma/tau [bacterium]
MSLVLYRKYRPQRFDQVIGQDFIVKILQSEIKHNRLAHAYLFAGPRGLGKTTVARILAKAVNCLNLDIKKEIEPCNQCEVCRAINSESSFNLIEIDGASNRGIDQIRELKEKVRFPPSIGKKKVIIIDEVHMLTIEAFNALLKTLEEPPEFTIFILATTEPHQVPETIISRCQRFDFKKVPADKIVQRLGKIAQMEKKKVPKDVLKDIAYYSQGCVRDAETLLGQVLSLPGKEITADQASLFFPRHDFGLLLDFSRLLLEKNTSQAIKKLNEISEQGLDLDQFRQNLLEFFRKLLLLKQGVDIESFTWSDKEKQEVEKILKIAKTKALVKIIEELLKISTFARYSPIPQFPFEIAIVRIGLDE